MSAALPAHEDVELPSVPLLDGIARDDIERLEHFMARFEVAEGELLFRQHDQTTCMHLLQRGRVTVYAETAHGAQVLAELGPGDLLGEISMLHAGTRSATAMAAEPESGWVLYTAAMETLRMDTGSGSVELTARLAELAVSRLRARYQRLAAELGASEDRVATISKPAPADPELYALEYLRSLLCFRHFHDGGQVLDAIGDAVPYELPRGSLVSTPGDTRDELLLVLRGALEVSLRGGGAVQGVRLAGPGRFVGHGRLLDGGPEHVVAHARERVVLVALAGARVRRMLRDPSAVARRFSAAIAEDAARALRHAERPVAPTRADSHILRSVGQQA